MFKLKFLSISYILLIICLFLYSYTQVDLNLTLSQLSFWQIIEKSFQHVGWFQRPLSATLFLVIVTVMTAYYGIFLWLAKENKLSGKQFWQIIIITSCVLLFSYNAFSYDLFNYMFDARIVTYHHENPYLHKALDYPQDPWITFMRWTHRSYPYGPTWLFLTVPLSFIGFQFFLPTLFLFKALASASFLGTVYVIGKIVKMVSPKNELFSTVFFALNPLVMIESLVSAHNDIVMIFLAIGSIYLLMNKKYFRTLLLLILSIGIKFATVFLLPILAIVWFKQKKSQTIVWNAIFLWIIAIMMGAVIVASIRTNFQPWYLLYVFPFAALLSRKDYILAPAIIGSFIILLEYVPYLYLGNWDTPVPVILHFLTIGAIVFSLIGVFVWNRWHLLTNKSA